MRQQIRAFATLLPLMLGLAATFPAVTSAQMTPIPPDKPLDDNIYSGVRDLRSLLKKNPNLMFPSDGEDLPTPDALNDQGLELLEKGKTAEAMVAFRESLAKSKSHPDWTAHLGLARGYVAKGDLITARQEYALAFPFTEEGRFNHPSYLFHYPHEIPLLIEYAQFLNRIGQRWDSVFVLDYAIRNVNYRNGDFNSPPFLPLLLPEMELSEWMRDYSPSRFQALSHLCLALWCGGAFVPGAEDRKHIEAAAKLLPGIAASHYYMGVALEFSHTLGPERERKARAEFLKAASMTSDSRSQEKINEQLFHLNHGPKFIWLTGPLSGK